MFRIKVVSWTIFLLVAAFMGGELRTSEPQGARSALFAVIIMLFLIQLDILGRYGKKLKPAAPRGDEQLG